MAKPRIMYFNDDRHSLAYMYEPPMQKEQWESAVDELVGTPVEALMFCLGDGRTVMHDSEVCELMGQNQDKWENLVVRRAYRTGSCYWFVFKLDRDHWPQQGANTLEVMLLNRDTEVVRQIRIRDVELETKYLMGRNFHRGFVDPDLGRYEGRWSQNVVYRQAGDTVGPGK